MLESFLSVSGVNSDRIAARVRQGTYTSGTFGYSTESLEVSSVSSFLGAWMCLV